MSKPNPIGAALQGVELMATQGRIPAVTGVFANAAVAYPPLVPFADAANFMAGLNRGKALFVTGVQSLCRSDALRGTIAGAMPAEQNTILRALAHPYLVTSGMAEASHALLSGIDTIGEGEWPVATLHTILSSVIQAGGLGELVVRLEARLCPFPPEEETAALAELHRIQRGFQWPQPAKELVRLMKAGLRGEARGVSVAEEAVEIAMHSHDFLCLSVLGDALRTSGLLPLSPARQHSSFLTDFLLSRSSPEREGESDTGSCYPWATLLGDLVAPYVGIGMHFYPWHVQIVHRETNIVCEIAAGGVALRLMGSQQWRQGGYLPPDRPPYPLRALIAVPYNNLSACVLETIPEGADDATFNRAVLERLRLGLVQNRICATDGGHRSIAHAFLDLEDDEWETAQWHLDQAEALHPGHPMTAMIRGMWLVCMGRREEGEAELARARRLAELQCLARDNSGCDFPPLLSPQEVDICCAHTLETYPRGRPVQGLPDL